MIRLSNIENRIIDPKELFIDILYAYMQTIQSTVYMMLKALPAQVVFGRDILFNLSFKLN